MPKAEAENIIGEFAAYTESIRRSGHYLGGNALQPAHTATTLRVRNGRLATTDGRCGKPRSSWAATTYLVQARDLNEAIQVAARIPGARLGAVEVRPILEV